MTQVKLPHVLAILAIAMPVFAHHAMDPRGWNSIEVKGVIEFISWDGPHVMYRIRSTTDRNEVVNWEVLGASPKILSTRNIAKATFNVGEQITVTGWKDPNNNSIAPNFFVTADGHSYEMGFYPSSMK